VTRKQRRTRRGSTTTPAPEHLQRRTCAALPGHALTRVTSHGTKHCSCAARRPKLLARALPALGRPGGGLRMWPPWRRHSTAARAPPGRRSPRGPMAQSLDCSLPTTYRRTIVMAMGLTDGTGALNAVDELASIRALHTHPRLTMGPKRLVYVENGRIQKVQ